MGNNIVLLNDRKYMTKLMSRIREDFEFGQKKRIEERKVSKSNTLKIKYYKSDN